MVPLPARTGAALDGTAILTSGEPRTPPRRSLPPTSPESVALDWSVGDLDGVVSIGHGGVTAGHVSDLVVVPERDFVLAGLTNATNGAPVNQAVRRFALERFAGIDERIPNLTSSLVIDVGSLRGRFSTPSPRFEVTPGPDPGIAHRDLVAA